MRLLTEQMSAWDTELPAGSDGSLTHYARLLAGYDEANVIGSRDYSRIVVDHLLDSLSCGLFQPLGSASTLVDIGSGGGLPGIPLKIILPRLDVLLLDATAKKARFLNQAIGELGLSGVDIAQARAEDFGRDDCYRGQYDVATARAVARLSVLAEYCLPLVRRDGFVVAMKGSLVDEEMEEGKRAVQELHGEIAEIIRVPFVPDIPPRERHLIILEKTGETPRKYPRRPGQPAKRPLGRIASGTGE